MPSTFHPRTPLTHVGRLVVVASLLNAAGAAAQTPAPHASAPTGRNAGGEPLAHAIDSLFAAELSAKRFTGAAFALVRDTTVTHLAGYGVANARTRTPVDPTRTIFRAASVSKLFVATAAMQMAERGVDLHADVNRYLRGFQLDPGPAVTLASLLTHTSGLENRAIGSLARDSTDLEPLRDYFSHHTPRREAIPGERFAYSNVGIGLAGYVVESVSGEPFDEYVARHILMPLGMRSSTFHQPVPIALQGRMANAARFARAPLFEPYPAGALMTTADDMSRFIMAMLNGGRIGQTRILSDSGVRAIERTWWTSDNDAPGVALGWFEGTWGDRRILYHTGDSGHHGIIVLDPGERLGFYAVYDTDDAASHEMMERLTRLVLGLGDHEPSAIHVHADSLLMRDSTGVGAFTGTYVPNGNDLRTIERAAGLFRQIRVSDAGAGRLRIEQSGGPSVLATRVGTTLFRATDGAWVSFRADARGRYGELTVTNFLSDPLGAHRVPRYARATAHLIVLVAALGMIVLRLAVGVRGMLARRRGSASALRSPSRALSAAIVACVILAPLAAASSVLTTRPPYVAVPLGAKIGLLLLSIGAGLSCVLAVWIVIAASRRGFRSIDPLDAVFALVMCAAAASLTYWNVLWLRW